MICVSLMCLMHYFRELEEGLCEMTCTLNIAANLLCTPRGYKYVVYSPKMTNHHDCFEYLHSFAGSDNNHDDPNRWLKVYIDGNLYLF